MEKQIDLSKEHAMSELEFYCRIIPRVVTLYDKPEKPVLEAEIIKLLQGIRQAHFDFIFKFNERFEGLK